MLRRPFFFVLISFCAPVVHGAPRRITPDGVDDKSACGEGARNCATLIATLVDLAHEVTLTRDALVALSHRRLFPINIAVHGTDGGAALPYLIGTAAVIDHQLAWATGGDLPPDQLAALVNDVQVFLTAARAVLLRSNAPVATDCTGTNFQRMPPDINVNPATAWNDLFYASIDWDAPTSKDKCGAGESALDEVTALFPASPDADGPTALPTTTPRPAAQAPLSGPALLFTADVETDTKNLRDLTHATAAAHEVAHRITDEDKTNVSATTTTTTTTADAATTDTDAPGRVITEAHPFTGMGAGSNTPLRNLVVPRRNVAARVGALVAGLAVVAGGATRTTTESSSSGKPDGTDCAPQEFAATAPPVTRSAAAPPDPSVPMEKDPGSTAAATPVDVLAGSSPAPAASPSKCCQSCLTRSNLVCLCAPQPYKTESITLAHASSGQ